MVRRHFSVIARVSTDSPAAVKPVLEAMITKGSVGEGEEPGEFLIEAEMEGESARELNRMLLSPLRRVEKRTRLRAEWTSGNTTVRFFDYVQKKSWRTADGEQ